MTQDRWLDLDGVVNMRDLGGLPTHDGGGVKPHRLIRSDNLQDLSERDVARIVGELEVTDILDLRSETEVRVSGPTRLSQVATLTHHNHSFLGRPMGDAAGAAALAAAINGEREDGTRAPLRDAAFWAGHYLGYLTDRADAVSAALRVVASSRGATIVHCAAGKDRTGTLVALALDVAGVPHEEIVADYALSGQRLQAILERLRASALYAPALATQTLDDQLTRPKTMEAILSTLTGQFGGAAGWLHTQGWSSDQVAALRSSLVA